MRLPSSLTRMMIEKMRTKARQMEGATSVAIVVGWDVDALMALEMLERVLDHNSITPIISSVSTRIGFRETMKKLAANSNIRSIVTLNVGALEDLTEYAFAANPKKYIYVLDSHRPVHHANLSCDELIVVIDDGHSGMTLCPSTKEVELQAQYHRRLQAGDVEAALSLASPSMQSGARQSAAEEYKDPAPTPFGIKRGLEPVEQDQSQINLESIQAKIINYYRGTFFAGPTAGILYELLQQEKLETKQSVWNWGVGLIDQLIHLKSTEQAYEEQFQKLSAELGRLERKAGGNALNEREQEDQGEEANPQTPEVSKTVGAVTQIKALKAPLLEFSSLRRSMETSSFFFSMLRLDRREGKNILDQLISRLGISKMDAEQKYKHTASKIGGTAKLIQLLESQEIALQHFEDVERSRPSLQRQFGDGLAVEAGDFALALAASLENPVPLDNHLQSLQAHKWGFGDEEPGPLNHDDGKQKVNYAIHKQRVQEQEEKFDQKNWLRTYEIARNKKSAEVVKILDLAVRAREEEAKAASYLLQSKGSIFKLKNYCETTLLKGKKWDNFIHGQLAQSRVLGFIREGYSKKVPDPIIMLIVQNPHSLALTVTGSPSTEIVRFQGPPLIRNPWNQYFEQLEGAGVHTLMRSLDPHFREVQAHDHLNFVVELSKLHAS